MASMTTSSRSDGASAHDPGGDWKRVALVSVVTWMVLCGLVLAWGWLLTHPLESSVDPVDDDVARWFAAQREPGLTDAADAGTFLGETIVGASAFTVIGLLVSLLKRTWRPIVLVAIVEAGLGGFYFFGTELIPRDRPPVKLLDSGLAPGASYPSGHVATALVCCAGAVILVWTYFRAARWVALALLVLPVWTLVSRLYLGAHHLTDALTSVVYASVWLLVVAGVLLPRHSALEEGRQARHETPVT
jgi:membrane-associated phospholipid phosphatase